MNQRNTAPANSSRILEEVERYYSGKVQLHGATARGVDWNSAESQRLRFEQLLKVCARAKPFSINDYGCGYGALADYMDESGFDFEYCGFDISDSMIEKAKGLHTPGAHKLRFVTDEAALTPADYTVASGIFNVRLKTSAEEWEKYALEVLNTIDSLSLRGFSFNMLTKYSDLEFMRENLYYADPLFVFHHCKTHYSSRVALLHDYPLYEFTILVRKG
jgi:SAM-dependent methyltransferase